jgi:hypothetical protein
MRDILDKLDSIILTEGRGLAARNPGEEFVNKETGQVIKFDSLTFYPPVGNFESPEEVEKAVNAAQTSNLIHWTNTPTKNSLAFGIAKFTDEYGAIFCLGRYFNEIKANRIANDFPHSAIPGFKYNSGRGKSENAGYKITQILNQFTGNTPNTIATQIMDHFGPDSYEAQAINIFMASNDFPITIPAGNMNKAAFEVYFCEMLQPIALVREMSIGGNWKEAVNIFFGSGARLKGCTINFNDTTSGMLSDSALINPDGIELRISTKGSGGGANASAKNLIQQIKELEKTVITPALRKKIDSILPIVTVFDKQSKSGMFNGVTHFSAPVTIATQNNIITEAEAKQLETLYLLEEKYISVASVIGKNVISKRLEGWLLGYQEKWPSKKLIPIHTLMIVVAGKVAKYVNTQTDFSEAAAAILNNGALIQVYTQMSQVGDNFVIEGFNAHYPSNAVTGVELSTAGGYMTNRSQGNMTFKILTGGQKSSEVDSDINLTASNASIDAETEKQVSKVVSGRTSIRPPGVKATREKNISLPREKR